KRFREMTKGLLNAFQSKQFMKDPRAVFLLFSTGK
ncbi:unnamed protein product, partial [marine sediment metagenome]